MKPARFVAGLTGGIGTGKSSALAQFKRCGAAVICLDQIAREQARPGRPALQAIVKAFGKGVLGRDGRLDRRALGRKIFRAPAFRRRLERATHPLILREMDRKIARETGVVVVDVPLLFEQDLEPRFDATVVVSCRAGEQIRRVARRDRISPADALARVKAQHPLKRKIRRADLTLNNDGSRALLGRAVRAAHRGLALLYGGTLNGHPH